MNSFEVVTSAPASPSWRGYVRTAWVLALLVVGCGAREVVLLPDLQGSSEPPEPVTWADFVDGLNLPSCAPSRTWVVTTTTTELDGGQSLTDLAAAGESLSFVEALWMANNLSGPDRITFDRETFARDAPATIRLTETVEFPVNLTEVCIDGRDAGVIFEWETLSDCVTCVWDIGSGSQMIGVTLLGHPKELTVSDGRVAGCRFDTDGERIVTSGSRPWTLNLGSMLTPGTLGPGNVFAARPARVWRGSVAQNFFGWDPVARRALGLTRAIDLRGPADITDNDFLSDMPVDALAGAVATLTGNRVGRPVEEALEVESGGLTLSAGRFVVGPGNVIQNTATAVRIGSAVVSVTRNAIFGNGAGIVYSPFGEPPVAPPAVQRATRQGASGTCAGDGTVEVFADEGDQGETFIGAARCEPDQTWRIEAELPEGLNATATLTDTQGRTSAFSAPQPIP